MNEQMVKILLPRGRKNEENFVIVSVNGRSWKIMRGVEVEVPLCAAEVLENARIDLVSEMPDEFVRSIFLNPQPSAQTALDEAFQRYGPEATVLAMPFGGSTLPVVSTKGSK